MRDALSTYLRARPGSPLAELAEATLARDGELDAQAEAGPDHPLMAHAAELEAAAGQLRLEMTGYDARANVRIEVARYLENVVIPTLRPSEGLPEVAEDGRRRRARKPLERVRELPGKLREARRQCWFQLDTASGATRTLWDQKAGEPLLCPDDAREESQRLTRRLEGAVEALARKGLRVYYAVLTIENATAGGLQPRVAKLWRKFQRLLKARAAPRRCRPAPRLHVHAARACTRRSWRHSLSARNMAPMFRPPVRRENRWCKRTMQQRRVPQKSLPKLFPIEGAIATLEAPLSASRTWHPHLNVIFVTRGRLDYAALWREWGCVLDVQALKPGNVAAAFRELIKYAVRAVPEKSQEKASCSSNSPSSRSASSSAVDCGDSPSAWRDGMRASSGAVDTGGSSPAPSSASARPPKRPPGPAMVEWTAPEWLEWWTAMKGRRRTRTYGELYGLNVETEEDERAQWVTIGKGQWTPTGYRVRIELLESIPGDKSILNIRTRYDRWVQGLTHPPDFYRTLAGNLATARELLALRELTV